MHQVFAEKPVDAMRRYFEGLAERLAPQEPACRTREEWEARRAEVRRRLLRSLGDFPFDRRPPLEPRVVGRIDHGDHVVEKVVYESLPGLYVPGLAYVPKRREGRVPAVLYVNGHWPLAKAQPLIQQCCMGLASQGVVAFCQDVVGTGERALATDGPLPGYHGLYRGAVPWIVGRSLTGTILYECTRALDYLLSRPEVDPQRIMVTGGSGGGKQTMLLAALDDRLAGAVPVVYVTSYQTHIGATGCVGEVPLGILTYTDQWELLGIPAPRPLLGIAATEDVSWFQPRHMHEALAKTRERIYGLYGHEERVAEAVVESPHDYNREMREILYNHVARWLQGVEDPHVSEPDDLPVEDPEALRCGLPAENRSVVELTYRQAREMVSAIPVPATETEWGQQRREMLQRLDAVLGPSPDPAEAHPSRVRTLDWQGRRLEHWVLETEPGVPVPALLWLPDADGRRPAVLVVDEDGKQAAVERGLVERLAAAGFVVLAIDYRGAGETADERLAYEGIADHNPSNYGLYLGRPLAGMRAFDVRCAVAFLAGRPEVDPTRIMVVGRGMGAFAGLLAALQDGCIAALAAEEMLQTWVFGEEMAGIGISYLVPGILKAGDIGHLAACAAPRPLLLLNLVDGRRRPIEDAAPPAFTRRVYELSGAAGRLAVQRAPDEGAAAAVVEWLRAA